MIVCLLPLSPPSVHSFLPRDIKTLLCSTPSPPSGIHLLLRLSPSPSLPRSFKHPPPFAPAISQIELFPSFLPPSCQPIPRERERRDRVYTREASAGANRSEKTELAPILLLSSPFSATYTQCTTHARKFDMRS